MVHVAIDAGPLHGPRTGIGNAVAWTIDALGRCDQHDGDVSLQRYVTSARAQLEPGERRLPLPAAFAHRLWARLDGPPMDRWLGRPDVVHGTNYVVPPTRAPQIVSVYDCWFVEHPAEAHPDVARAGAVLRRAIDRGAHVITSSDATSERVRHLFDARSVHTVHLGPPLITSRASRIEPPPEPADSALDSDTPFVLALGTVERRKNIPTLVGAFERLAAEHPTIHLRIAGRDGDDSVDVARAIDRLPRSAQRRVVRHRSVSEPVKRWLLDNASVLAYPSLDEGFGFPILEAQLAEVPVVGSSAGSIPEIAGAGALLCLPLDSDALAANLFWAITSASKCDQLVARGRINVERFSWRRTATTLTEHYRRRAGGGT